jgi:hypothetical protein
MKMESKLTFAIDGEWHIEGFPPMSTEEFSQLLLKIDAAKYIASLKSVPPSQPKLRTEDNA